MKVVPGTIFVSYAAKDIKWLERLRVHLTPVAHRHSRALWDDTKIAPGDEWQTEFSNAVSSATVAILLVSADFLASDFVLKNQLQPLLDRAEKGGTRIIPLVVGACDRSLEQNLWKYQPQNPNQALGTLDEGVAEHVLAQLAQRVDQILANPAPQGQSSPTPRSRKAPQTPSEPPSTRRLKTYLTQVFYRHHGKGQDPQPLERSRSGPGGGKQPVYLFDDLLGGGIVIPDDIRRAKLGGAAESTGSGSFLGPDLDRTPGLLMLVTGSPGSGKSTFALELCYRLACNDNSELDEQFRGGLSSLYVCAEASARSLIQNAQSYGWKNAEEKLKPISLDYTIEHPSDHKVFLFGRDSVERMRNQHGLREHGDTSPPAPESAKAADVPRESAEATLNAIAASRSLITAGNPGMRPQVLVIDSLNGLGPEVAAKKLSKILERHAAHYLLTIAIIDTGPGMSREHHWAPFEYLADIEIDFSYERPENYMIRRVWIVKARFQDHADGYHRMKINPLPRTGVVANPLDPVIKEGGIFVFPSVHRHLSLARGQLEKTPPRRHRHPIRTPFKALNQAIQGGGFPAGSCTCIVGDRGGMKSHLAYYTLLEFLRMNENERAIVISLRDPEEAAIQTLAEILLQQKSEDGARLVRDVVDTSTAQKHVLRLIEDDRLEILYFWPGYISPEEFFHLVCTSVDRPGKGKEGRPAAFLVINGLEQLSARFPLCEQESMFVSGLLSVLFVKGVTVLITSGGLANRPPGQGGVPAGLLPMSDLIVEASFRLLPPSRVWSADVWEGDKGVNKSPAREKVALRARRATDLEPHVIYEIVREPGARECRRRVLFYMGRDRDDGFAQGSVYVRPLADDFPHGERPQ